MFALSSIQCDQKHCLPFHISFTFQSFGMLQSSYYQLISFKFYLPSIVSLFYLPTKVSRYVASPETASTHETILRFSSLAHGVRHVVYFMGSNSFPVWEGRKLQCFKGDFWHFRAEKKRRMNEKSVYISFDRHNEGGFPCLQYAPASKIPTRHKIVSFCTPTKHKL